MRVGIVTPAFNAAPWIADAVRSVLAQSHADWRLIVVDDGSADTTAELVAAFSDVRITLIRQVNAGVAAARNRGIAALDACGAVLFLDADDWLAPSALTRLLAGLRPETVAVVGPCAFVPASGAPPPRPPAGDLLERLLTRNLLVNGGHCLLRRAAVDQAGGFRVGIAYGEDWEYWTRIAASGDFAAIGGAPVLFVRQRADGACRAHAGDPLAFSACLEAIFGNPALAQRFGPRLPALRRQAEAERDWIVGRELIRTGRAAAGRRSLHRSLCANPSARRALLCVLARILPVLPPSWQGPFRPYGA